MSDDELDALIRKHWDAWDELTTFVNSKDDIRSLIRAVLRVLARSDSGLGTDERMTLDAAAAHIEQQEQALSTTDEAIASAEARAESAERDLAAAQEALAQVSLIERDRSSSDTEKITAAAKIARALQATKT